MISLVNGLRCMQAEHVIKQIFLNHDFFNENEILSKITTINFLLFFRNYKKCFFLNNLNHQFNKLKFKIYYN